MKKKIHSLIIILAIGSVLLPISVSAASIVFSDDFTTDTIGGAQTGALNNWSITSGNLDVLGVGFFQQLCKNGSGQCLDMGGTSSNSSIATLSSFALTPGDYLFEFDYANNTSSGNTLSYTIGGLLNGGVTSTLANGVYTTESQAFSVTSLTNVNISFVGGGPADSGGTVLDNVNLTQTSSTGQVPEPAVFWLIGLGGICLIGTRKTSKSSIFSA